MKIVIYFTGYLITLFTLTSCINEDYSLNNIETQVVFSQNGLDMPIGSFERFNLEFYFEGIIDSLIYQKDFEGFFSEDLYKLFVIERNGIDEAIGYIEFTGKFQAYIKNERKDRITVNVVTQALDSTKNVIIEMGNNSMFANNNEELETQDFILKIAEKDVVKIKKAEILRFKFTVGSADVDINSEDNNYVNINDMRIISSGGIAFDFSN